MEKQTLSNGFRVLLLGCRHDPAADSLLVRAMLFDGGRECQAVDAAGSWWNPAETLVRDVRQLLCHVLDEPHILALHGNAARGFLDRVVPDLLPHCRILSLRAAAGALAGLSARPDDAQLANAYSLMITDREDMGFSPFTEDLLWAVVARASEEGLDWGTLIALPETSRAPACLDAYQFGEVALALIPPTPGVYVMRDAHAHPLYVGKAKCLSSRLTSYFRARGRLPRKIARIREQIRTFEYHLVGSELEALLLENRLITELAPEVNVQRAIAPGRSRYEQRPEPIAIVCPSTTKGRCELFAFGRVAEAFQLRAVPERPPTKTLQRAVQFLSGHGAAPPASARLTYWGAAGNEICWRYWSRFRSRLRWLYAGGCFDRDSDVLRQAVRAAARSDAAAEFRMHERSGTD